ncbi:MAG: hypothetical protein HY821_17105 [Acidobacteria bacterium]|nr:hypothetical protein [Acidobacteriota bacterium]
MRTTLLAAVAVMAAPAAFADWGINVNIGTAPYYGYAPQEVVYVERYVPAYEVPQVFVVARHARIRPAVVVDYYRRHPSWNSVCARFGVPDSVFYGNGYAAQSYVAPPPPAYYYRPGPPPRGHGHGHYKSRGHWRD